MNLTTIIFIATALAMDAFAVSIATGTAYKHPKIKHAFRIALAFGSFQAIMPLIGWYAGSALKNLIKGYDHWAAFFLLCFIGCKMIYESFKIKNVQYRSDLISTTTLLILAVATSIDALAVGITFSFLIPGSIVIAIIIIGLITFAFSYVGFYIGKILGHLFETSIQALGGAILLVIAAKILLEHLSF